MRMAAIVVCYGFLQAIAYAQCVTVEEPKPQETSRHLTISVELAGGPLRGVKVDVYPRDSKQAIFEGTTDEYGTVAPPELALGEYNVFAALNQAVVSSLQVRAVRAGPVTRLPITFGSVIPGVGKNLSIHDHLQIFQGTVQDPTGAPVPAAIVVVERDAQPSGVVARSIADANGHFSEKLRDGSYVGFFFASGFRTATVPFEITGKGSGELSVNLRIGGCP